jgi:tetratricopeptide (TPR) repeat protein
LRSVQLSFLLPLLLSTLTSLAAHAQEASAPAAQPAPTSAGAAVVPAAVVPAPAAPAAAPAPPAADQEARTSFEAGKAAYDEGEYAVALVQFERAYALSKRSLLLYNIGLAHDRLQHEERALESFEAYLEAHPNDERSADARARVKVLRERLAAPGASAQSEPEPTRSERMDPRRKRIWIYTGVAFAVVAIGAGVTVALVTGKDEDPGPRQPNSGVRIEALSW